MRPTCCRHVRADRQRALRDRIDGTQQFLGARRLEPRNQRLLEFRQRRHHAAIAMARHRIEHLAHEARVRFRLRRQAIGKAFGQEAGGECVGHVRRA